MEEFEYKHTGGKRPYDMGIKNLKRLLKHNNNLTRAEKNKVVKNYKKRITERLLEIKELLD